MAIDNAPSIAVRAEGGARSAHRRAGPSTTSNAEIAREPACKHHRTHRTEHASRRRRGIGVLLSLALLGLPQVAPAGPQAATLLFYPDDPLWADPDDHDIRSPQEAESSPGVDAVTDALADGEMPEILYAANVNTIDEVPDSTWFTNRHGMRRMSAEELRRGPDRAGPPAPGEWKVVDVPSSGKTPKFTVEDGRGKRYLVKLDSLGYPELMSSAEVIGTKLFYAFGYNVPENYVAFFDPGQLVFEEKEVEPSAAGLLLERLAQAPRDDNDRVRALASLMLEGEPAGPFSYSGTRFDDPNDIFPHEHRRELRGMRVFAAWLNHTDVKDGNSLDMLVEEDGRQFLRHYLIDFGSILGSAAVGVKDPVTGYEAYFEPDVLLKSMLTLGFWARPYLLVEYPEYPAVGRLEADYFDPAAWKPPISNPAFDRMDEADAFWAARIASRFTADDLRAVVASAEISDPEAERTMVELLEARRRKTVGHWLVRTNPLDAFRAETGPQGARLLFDNAAERTGVVQATRGFRYRWMRLDNDSGVTEAVGDERTAAEPIIPVPDDAWGRTDPYGLRYARVDIGTLHDDFPHWDRPVQVVLRDDGDRIEVAGVRRPRARSEN